MLSAWCYVIAWAATLADQLAHVPHAGDVAGIAILLFLLLEFRRQRRYAQVLFVALFAIGMVGVVLAADPALCSWPAGGAVPAMPRSSWR